MVCTVACFIGFWRSVFGGSASLHNLFLHFLAKCFFNNIMMNMEMGGINLFSVNSGAHSASIIFFHLSSNAFRIYKSSAHHIL